MAGREGRRGNRPAAHCCAEQGRALGVGDDPDRWAPPVGGCVREGGREAGRGRRWAGGTGPRRGKERKKKKRGEVGWAAGRS
jgi:hypothetical protein